MVMKDNIIKVVKFGGSSLADAEQFKKVGEIIRSESSRRYVVPSAPGKRFREDTKVTDMLYECYSKAKAKESIDEIYSQIVARYTSIIDELGLDFDMSGEFLYVKNAILHSSNTTKLLWKKQKRKYYLRNLCNQSPADL